MSFLDVAHQTHRQPSFNARALDLASEIGDNKFNTVGGGIGGAPGDFADMPASFSEAFLRDRDLERMRHREEEEEKQRHEAEEKGMVNRIMLARMNTLEEGFREVLKEIKTMSATGNGGGGGSGTGVSRQGSEGEVLAFPLPGVKARVKAERGDGKRSPRKVGKKSSGGKGKEAERERPGTGLKEEEVVASEEAQSPISVLGPGQAAEGDGEAKAGDERPTTAIETKQWDD